MDGDQRALVLRAQGGDSGAFTSLVERHWMRLLRFARSVVGASDAEDAVQEAFVKAWEKLPGLREPDAFSGWLLRIATRKCIRRVRRRRFLIPLADVADPPDRSSQGDLETFEVERVLSVLPARQRAVMHFTVIEGMSDSEIGSALGIAAASVRSHRRRARESLDKILQTSRNVRKADHGSAREP
jgi:RNA polymerase sigma-70 factor (ECF subfamily)